MSLAHGTPETYNEHGCRCRECRQAHELEEFSEAASMQLSLPPFQRHSETSRKAALGAYREAPNQRARVLAELRERGPATDEQLQERLGLNPSAQRPRRVELVAAGLVRDSGKRAKTRSGRAAVLWEVTPA